jgi:hypothetical protein
MGAGQAVDVMPVRSELPTASGSTKRSSMTSEAPMKNAELEKRILRLHKGGTGILKIGKALGVGTGTVQRVLMERPRPFDVGASA